MRYLLIILIGGTLLSCFAPNSNQEENFDLEIARNGLGKDFETFFNLIEPEQTHIENYDSRRFISMTTASLQSRFANKPYNLFFFSAYRVIDIESVKDVLSYTLQADRQYGSIYKITCDSELMSYIEGVEELERWLDIALLIEDITISSEILSDGKITFINGRCIDYVAVTEEEVIKLYEKVN